MTDLLDRLRKVDGSDEGTHWYRNPDGPEAAAEIERLRDAIERAGRCLAMSNNGAREALDILRTAKGRRSEA